MITSSFWVKILLEFLDLVFHHFDFALDLSCRLDWFYGNYFFFWLYFHSIGGHFTLWLRLHKMRGTTKTGFGIVCFDHFRFLHYWVLDSRIGWNIVWNHRHRSKWVVILICGRMDQTVHVVWIHHVVSEFKLFLMSGVLNLWLIRSVEFILD